MYAFNLISLLIFSPFAFSHPKDAPTEASTPSNSSNDWEPQIQRHCADAPGTAFEPRFTWPDCESAIRKLDEKLGSPSLIPLLKITHTRYRPMRPNLITMPLRIDAGSCRMLIDYSVPWMEHDDTQADMAFWVHEGTYLVEGCRREGTDGRAKSLVIFHDGVRRTTMFQGIEPAASDDKGEAVTPREGGEGVDLSEVLVDTDGFVVSVAR